MVNQNSCNVLLSVRYVTLVAVWQIQTSSKGAATSYSDWIGFILLHVQCYVQPEPAQTPRTLERGDWGKRALSWGKGALKGP